MKRIIPVIILAVLLGGCAGTSFKKSVQKTLPISVQEMAAFTRDVMNDHDFDIQTIDPKDGSIQMTGKHFKGQDISVDIVPLESGARIKIKVTDAYPWVSAQTIFNEIAVRY